jgi:hypothetical protein
MARNKSFAKSSFNDRTTFMTLVIISIMLLLPFYHIPQLAWSHQPQQPAQDNNVYTRAQTEHVQVEDINIA